MTNYRSFLPAEMRRTATGNPHIGEQPMSFVRLGSSAEKFTDSSGKGRRTRKPELGDIPDPRYRAKRATRNAMARESRKEQR